MSIDQPPKEKGRAVGQLRLLEMVAIGAPLHEILDVLMLFVESREPGLHCGLLLAADDGVFLRPGSAPSASRACMQAVHEAMAAVPITPPYFASCAEAAHRNESILVPDVANDTRYAGAWRDLMLSSGLMACRSTPVRGSDGRVLGCLTVYFDRPCDPNPADPELIEMATHVAAIAIERDCDERGMADELADAELLWKLSSQLVHEENVNALYQQILDAAMAVMRSDFGSMQMLHSMGAAGEQLHLLAHRGFSPEAASFWEWVRLDSQSTCGAALRTSRRIIVQDVEICDFMTGTADLQAYRQTGVRAVQTTPLVSRSGHVVGMISTHWRAPHQPSGRQLRLLDVLSRQAADLLDRSAARAEVRESEAKYRSLFDSIDEGFCIIKMLFDDEKKPLDYRFLEVNPAFERQTGIADAVGKTIREFAPNHEKEWFDIYGRVALTGEARRFERPATALNRFFDVYAFRVGAPEERRVAVLFKDITAQAQARETQQLLVEELNHRVKNTLASVQAIAHHTLRQTKDPVEFATSFGGRIQSLSRMHSLLSSKVWKGAELREVIRDQLFLGPIDGARVTAWGPVVHLKPQMALRLALMLHELGTNACKYGALSKADGVVTISWSISDETLCMKWAERGGPPVKAPSGRGFGMTLIEQSAKGEGGKARMSVEADGLHWEITLPMPLAASVDPSKSGASDVLKATLSREIAHRTDPRPAKLAGKRFLVVEDEPLVALDVKAGLQEAGAEVAGPVGTPTEALQAIEAEALDAALLDANLRGHPVDEIAAALSRKRIPFIFVTGYGRESLPQSFGNVAVLSKPFSQEQLIEAAAQLVETSGNIARLKL